MKKAICFIFFTMSCLLQANEDSTLYNATSDNITSCKYIDNISIAVHGLSFSLPCYEIPDLPVSQLYKPKKKIKRKRIRLNLKYNVTDDFDLKLSKISSKKIKIKFVYRF